MTIPTFNIQYSDDTLVVVYQYWFHIIVLKLNYYLIKSNYNLFSILIIAEDEVDPNTRVSRAEILSNAKLIEEDYFVAPTGNIPLQQDPQKYEKTKK